MSHCHIFNNYCKKIKRSKVIEKKQKCRKIKITPKTVILRNHKFIFPLFDRNNHSEKNYVKNLQQNLCKTRTMSVTLFY